MIDNKVENKVILVDKDDRQTGLMEKMEAHQKGLLHRAFSVFIFNSKDELLIHQRSMIKYHSGGLWTNTCCSHPYPGENISNAAVRRLQEEMGMRCVLHKAFQFTYNIPVQNNLIEHELDHVFIGISDIHPLPDNGEVQDWKYMNMDLLATEIQLNPEKFTVWLRQCFDQVYNYYFTIGKNGI